MASSSAPAMQPPDRRLDWDGCFNVRDLGGQLAAGRCTTRWGAIVRSDTTDRLTEAGWEALRAHGITTIVDLRDAAERDDRGADGQRIDDLHGHRFPGRQAGRPEQIAGHAR